MSSLPLAESHCWDDYTAVLARGGPEALRATAVLGTLVAGAWTHRSAALG